MAEKPDKRDAFIEARPKRVVVQAPPQLLEDLRHFRKRHDEGRSISVKGLTAYILAEYELKVPRYRASTMCREAGVEPWFAV